MKKQMGTKKMTLNRETLRALEAGEIRKANGGAVLSSMQPNCPDKTDVTYCVSCRAGTSCE
jgi:hypothetical protein